ncbi:MAG: glycerate kinase [Bellilinea sp.]
MLISKDSFRTHTLDRHPRGEQVKRILLAGLRAVDPATAVARFLVREGDLLFAGGRSYDLSRIRRVILVGAGKAAAPMARAVARIVGDRLSGGMIITKQGFVRENTLGGSIPERIQVVEASHPIPDERGVAATRRIIALLRAAGQRDLVIAVISGGGSALMTAPAAGIDLIDLQTLTNRLLASGACIDEINVLRKHLDEVKGGGLARATGGAQLLSLALSDVVGDALDVIASGPTVADPTHYEDAYTVLKRYDLLDRTPPAILNHIQMGRDGHIADTPKPGDPVFDRVNNMIIASNRHAAQAALNEAEDCGFSPHLLSTYMQGEANQIGRLLGAIARQIDASRQPFKPPACVVMGGEATVTLRGDGLGGRNLEVALGAVRSFDGLKNLLLVTLASDGDDGPTNAAGTVVSGDTLKRALALNLNPEEYLAANDSYHFFEPLGDLIRTGPTQTNVNDLAFLFAFEE